jgi:hypothetical protein
LRFAGLDGAHHHVLNLLRRLRQHGLQVLKLALHYLHLLGCVQQLFQAKREATPAISRQMLRAYQH